MNEQHDMVYSPTTSNDTMSLRDWIASQAGEDDIAAHTFWDLDSDAPDCTREQARYRYVEAMIAARSGGAA